MELETLYQLMDRFQRSGLTALEWRKGDEQVVLRRAGILVPAAASAVPVAASAASAAVPAAESTDDGDLVTAPLVGTFYASPSPDQPPFVTLGQHVRKDQVICIIEAMKMMSEIPAPYDGTVTEILAENEQAVGYGAPLLRLRRD